MSAVPIEHEHEVVVPIHREQAAGSAQILTWAEISHAATSLAARWRHVPPMNVYGVPTGGAPVAVLVASLLGIPLADRPGPRSLVVDDLVDTGRTLQPYLDQGLTVDALFRKPWSPPTICPHAELRSSWLRFPWEKDDGAPTDAVTRLLQFIGEDPTRDGLLNTPRRVVKALTEMTAGYRDDVAEILATSFDVAYGPNLIVLGGIGFTSLCEHHMLPFAGTATVAYVPGPDGRVVGLSKLARLVLAHARRLQVQERMTEDIAADLVSHLAPAGCAVMVSASHSCMSMRGVRAPGLMTTSSYHGVLADGQLRIEFMQHHRI